MEKQTINTSLLSTPTLSVAHNFTALHMASIAWDLYCGTVPTWSGEFSIHEGSDFAHYRIGDYKDMSEHYYDCAFSIARCVEDNPAYSIQDAYTMLDEICADTVVREEVSSTLYEAVSNYSHDSDADSNIAEDYAYLNEDLAQLKAQRIQELESQLAVLKAS